MEDVCQGVISFDAIDDDDEEHSTLNHNLSHSFVSLDIFQLFDDVLSLSKSRIVEYCGDGNGIVVASASFHFRWTARHLTLGLPALAEVLKAVEERMGWVEGSRRWTAMCRRVQMRTRTDVGMCFEDAVFERRKRCVDGRS